jgi:hypothetical protein
VRLPIPPYYHDSGVRALDPAVLRQPTQQDAVTPFAQAVEDDSPARGHEARGPAIDSHAETIDLEVGAVGADSHLDPAVGGDTEEGHVAAGGERQDRERNERLEACRHGNLLVPKHLAAPWRFP